MASAIRRRLLWRWLAGAASTTAATLAAADTMSLASAASSSMTEEPTEHGKAEKDCAAELAAEICGVSSYAANDPIEDRYFVERLHNGAWWFAVLDGHGGWQCSEYAHRRLHQNVGMELANRLGIGHEETEGMGHPVDVYDTEVESLYTQKMDDTVVAEALRSAFERTDRQYMTKVYGAFELGFGRDTRAGSCAIGTMVLDGVLFVANAGDSRAVLGVNHSEWEKLEASRKPRTGAPAVDILDRSKEPSVTIGEQSLREAAVASSTGSAIPPDVEAALRAKMLKSMRPELEGVFKGNGGGGMESKIEGQQVSTSEGRVEGQHESTLVTVTRFLTGGLVRRDIGESREETDEQSDAVLAIPLSNDHNCRETRERARLETEHPGESDVVVCRKNSPSSCYIKGKLQPSRALGDFYLKYSEFMRDPTSHPSAGRYINPPYTPPYISATPEVAIHRLRRGVDEFVVIGSDGLWDYVTNQEAVELVNDHLRRSRTPISMSKVSDALVELALSRAAERNKMTLGDLKSLPVGRQRRRKHDDVTVIVVDLARLLDQHYWG